MNVLRSLENEDEHKRMQMIRYLTTQKQALSINILVFNTPPPSISPITVRTSHQILN